MRSLRLIATGMLSFGALAGIFLAFCIIPKVEQAKSTHTRSCPVGFPEAFR